MLSQSLESAERDQEQKFAKLSASQADQETVAEMDTIPDCLDGEYGHVSESFSQEKQNGSDLERIIATSG